MTPDDALIELLDRLAAAGGDAVLLNEDELARWPATLVAAMSSQGLLTRAAPAAAAECPGCEEACVRPVHVLAAPEGPAAFVVCDARDDVNRVTVLSGRLGQWQASGTSLAGLLSGLLGLPSPACSDFGSLRWQVGVLRGSKHSSHIVLGAENGLSLSLAGYSVPVAEVLMLKGKALAVDKRRLAALVDQPAAGGGEVESAAQRQKRLLDRIEQERAKGTKAFLRVVAEEEGISVQRLKQIRGRRADFPAARSTW